MRTFPLIALDEVLDGSASAQYTFGPPNYFRGAQATSALINPYWQSGAYGIISVSDGLSQSYLWMQSTVHDGPATNDGDTFLMYTQIENPENAGEYESFSCRAVYRRG